MSDHTPDGERDPVDAELSRTGDELRSTASPVEGRDVIAGALRRKVERARRTNLLVAGVASLVVVGVLGLSAFGSEGSGDDDSASSDGGELVVEGVEGVTSAEAVVAALPPEPLDPSEVELVASVSRYDTCAALVDQLHKVGAAHVGSSGFGGYQLSIPFVDGYRADENARAVGAQTDSASAADGGAGGGSGGETLGTNVIVAGVDEPDTVKATDTLVVELAGPTLRVVDTTTARVVGTLELAEQDADEQRWAMPTNLLLEGRRAVVFGTESVAAESVPGDPSASRPHHQYLTVTFVDLGDPAAPRITDRARIEGSMVAVRRVGDQIRMVTSSSLADLPLVMPTSPNSVPVALEQNRLAVAGSAIEDWIPEWDRGESEPSEPLMGCDQVVVPDTFAGVQMTSMVQFDLDGPFEPQATGLLAPSEDLTATATDVVIGSHVWVDPIDRRDDFSDWSTALHRFSFADDGGGPLYLASGAVDGSIRDEFSMSILDDGTVGAVTVDVLPWDARDQAEVTVRLLATDEASSELHQVGSLVPEASGIAAAGVRFIGDRLLVATGLGGNVVSVVDLTDRSAPRDTGNVTVRGAGSYLHPLDGNRVLVVGETITEVAPERYSSGLHSTLVDMNGAPTVVDVWQQDDLSAQVSHDHHAFTWWPSRSMAAFGIQHHRRDAIVPPEAMFLTLGGESVSPRTVRPREAPLGPKCPLGQLDRTGCDDTGPPQVSRVLVVDGAPWLYTSESLERLDPQTFEPGPLVPLPPRW